MWDYRGMYTAPVQDERRLDVGPTPLTGLSEPAVLLAVLSLGLPQSRQSLSEQVYTPINIQ